MRNILHTDIIELIVSKYKSINNLDKNLFFAIFLILNVVFIFHTGHFLFGNHDWLAIESGVKWDSFLYEGRYTATAIKMLLTNGQIIPILNNVLAFFFYALSTVLLLNYWNAPKNFAQRLIIGLIFTITPFTNIWLWFAYHTIENLCIPLFSIIGLIFAYKQNNNVIDKFISVIFLVVSLGIYPAAIVNILTIFCCKLLIEVLNTNKFSLYFLFNRFKTTFINIMLSIIIYKFILIYLKHIKILQDMVNSTQCSILEILQHVPLAIKYALIQLWNYEYIAMPNSITIYFLILFILLSIIGIYKLCNTGNRFKKFILIFLLLLGIFLSMKMAAILSIRNVFYSPRIDFYGLVYFRGLIVCLLFKYSNIIIKNMTYILCLLILYTSIISNLICQKSFYLGLNSELMRANRLLFMLESNKNFSLNKTYDVIAIGYPTPTRPAYTPKGFLPLKGFEVGLGSHTLFPEWNPAGVLHFIEPELNINNTTVFIDEFQDTKVTEERNIYRNTLTNNDFELIKKNLNGLSVYPDKKSISIIDNKIVMVFSKNSYNKLIDFLNKKWSENE